MFEEYIKAVKNYAIFGGRATRKELWMFVLYNFLVSIAVGIVARIIHLRGISGLYSLFVLTPNIALATRRLHDIGRSGWWQLIGLVPIVGWIWLLIYYITPSSPEDNIYGPRH